MDVLETNNERGTWIKGIFLYHDPGFGRCDLQGIDINQLLVRLLHLSPNLRALDFDPYDNIGTAFVIYPELFSAIQTLTALKFVSWYIPFQRKVPMAIVFSKMPGLLSARLENSSSILDEQVDTAAPSVYLPSLETLALSRASIHTLTYMSTWAMPKLRTLDINLGFSDSVDDINVLLRAFGDRLHTLILQAFCQPSATVDVRSILAMCPNLTTFTFNLDWLFRDPLSPSSHSNLTRIGFNTGGSLFAFVTPDPNAPPWISHIPLSSEAVGNLSNLDKIHFPRLSTIRVLSGLPLILHMRQGGVDALDTSKSAAWTSLCQRCSSEGIRLEDATGNDFGKKPVVGDEAEYGIINYDFPY